MFFLIQCNVYLKKLIHILYLLFFLFQNYKYKINLFFLVKRRETVPMSRNERRRNARSTGGVNDGASTSGNRGMSGRSSSSSSSSSSDRKAARGTSPTNDDDRTCETASSHPTCPGCWMCDPEADFEDDINPCEYTQFFKTSFVINLYMLVNIYVFYFFKKVFDFF